MRWCLCFSAFVWSILNFGHGSSRTKEDFKGVTKMGPTSRKFFSCLFAKKEMCIFMVGLDATSKMTILYKLKLGDIVIIIPTIGEFSIYLFLPLSFGDGFRTTLHVVLHVSTIWSPLVGAPLKVIFTLFMPFKHCLKMTVMWSCSLKNWCCLLVLLPRCYKNCFEAQEMYWC